MQQQVRMLLIRQNFFLKLDGTAKGGVVVPISKEQNIPVKFVGLGEGIDDFEEFDPDSFARALFEQEID